MGERHSGLGSQTLNIAQIVLVRVLRIDQLTFFEMDMMFVDLDRLRASAAEVDFDSSFYFVVPHNAANDGSYGSDSDGAPRGVGLAQCLPQLTATCPPGR